MRCESNELRRLITCTCGMNGRTDDLIARWYLSRVFGRRRYINMPRGGFIEDTLGQHMLATVRGPRGVRAHADFGVFLFQDDTGQTKCGHIDGHDVMTESASCRKYGFSGGGSSAPPTHFFVSYKFARRKRCSTDIGTRGGLYTWCS